MTPDVKRDPAQTPVSFGTIVQLAVDHLLELQKAEVPLQVPASVPYYSPPEIALTAYRSLVDHLYAGQVITTDELDLFDSALRDYGLTAGDDPAPEEE